jgi:hypothetical protein
MADEIQTLKWQFELIWKLGDHHLPKLTDEACLWEPAARVWTVRKSVDGQWRPDWSDPEPDPAPAVTIGWLTWQMIWWWSSALTAALSHPVPPRESIVWPGSAEATVKHLDALSREWAAMLSALRNGDLARPVAHPWPEPRPLRLMLAWANVELAKNIAEIGTVRHLYGAQR